MIAAILDADNVIVNVVVVGEGWTPPEGMTVRDLTDTDGGIGWTWPEGANAPQNPNPPDPPVQLPVTASSGDFMKALIELGWYDDVDAAVSALPNTGTGKVAKVLWARASVIERDNPLLIQVGTTIGKTSADLDALFVLANSYV